MTSSSSFANRKPAAAASPAAAADRVTDGINPKATIAVQGVLAYPALTTPDEQSGAYQALIIVDPGSEDFRKIEALVRANSLEKFKSEDLPPRAFNPIRSGDEPAQRGDGYAFRNEAFRGKAFVRGKTKFQPTVVWGPDQTPIDPSEVHGGDTVVVELSAYAYDNQSRGVALSLGKIWLIARGTNRIERGASGGAALSGYDRSKLRFDVPSNGDM